MTRTRVQRRCMSESHTQKDFIAFKNTCIFHFRILELNDYQNKSQQLIKKIDTLIDYENFDISSISRILDQKYLKNRIYLSIFLLWNYNSMKYKSFIFLILRFMHIKNIEIQLTIERCLYLPTFPTRNISAAHLNKKKNAVSHTSTRNANK